MSLVQRTINHPVSVAVLFGIVAAFGLYLINLIPIDQYPNIEMPTVMIITSYSGAGPEEVEKTVTRVLEGGLVSTNNLDKMTSTSSEGSSLIQLEFTWGTNIADATNDIRDAIDRVRSSLPDNSSSPRIFKFNASNMPILRLSIRGSRSAEELKQIATDTVSAKLEQVNGVATVSVNGGRERAILVDVPEDRLAAYGLSIDAIAGTLAADNIQVTGGKLIQAGKQYTVRITGEYSSLDDIRNTILAYKKTTSGSNTVERPVLLRDIAKVYDGFKDASSVVYINGEPGVYLSVQKQSGTNSVNVATEVLKRVSELNRSGLPEGISLAVVQNTTTDTKSSISTLLNTALQGGLFTIIILFFFLRRMKSTIIVALSIPISILITVICMYFAGITLNILSLTGMALGVGMIVDNSIVVIENIYRYRERGAKIGTAAVLGGGEMINAITASTTTTVCVFVPLFIFRDRLGMIGQMFTSLSFTVIVAVLSSLLIAAFLVPVLSSTFLPLNTSKQRPIRNRALRSVDEAMERMFVRLDEAYKRALSVVLDHKLITVLVVAALMLVTLAQIPHMGLNLIPSTTESSITVSLKMPIGTPLATTLEVLQKLAQDAKEEVKGYKNITITAGSSGSGFSFSSSGTPYIGNLQVELVDYSDRIDSSETVKRKLRAHFWDFPDATFSFGSGRFQQMGGSSPQIQVKSDNLTLARETADRIRSLISGSVPEFTDAQVDMESGLPELRFRVDYSRAAALGVNISSVLSEIGHSINGATATTYNIGGDDFDVIVRLPESDRASVASLNGITVSTNSGERIPLSTFSSFVRSTGPVSIYREAQARQATVSGNLAPGAATTEVQARIENLIKQNIPADDNVQIVFAGSFSDVNNYSSEFVAIILMALILVFAVMAMQYESFLTPLIIFFTIPLMLIGFVGIYVITGDQLSMFSLVGVVMLFGIVVNNGIILVDYTNLMRKRGMSVHQACITAGGNRLRPILMTALTTIFGMIPVAFFSGNQSELWQPFGRTVIGGLTTSTFITLFFIPVVYSIFHREKSKTSGSERVAERGTDTQEETTK